MVKRCLKQSLWNVVLPLCFFYGHEVVYAQQADDSVKSKITREGRSIPPSAKRLSIGNALEREIRVGESLSDHYRAYRLGLIMRTKTPVEFYKSGFVPFLESYAMIASVKDMEKQCETLAESKNSSTRSLIYLTCGRMMLDMFELSKAQKYFEKISPASKEAVPGTVYLSSLYLGRGDGERCVALLNQGLRKKIRHPVLRDLFHMTRGRCFLELNKYDQAVLEYQLISPTSQYYYDSLEETSWAQFRTRRFESARTLLDVIITTYETGLGQNRSVSPSMYFRTRYLQAYIELIENNVPKATGQFNALEQAISAYMKPQVDQLLKARELTKKIIDDNTKWIDMQAMPDEVKQFLSVVGDWTDSAIRKKIERTIGLQFSLSRERTRLQGEAQFANYVEVVRRLESANAKTLETELVSAARAAAKSMRVLKIKSDLGRIEIKWVERTQGVRSIEELLESYKKEVDEVEDHFTL